MESKNTETHKERELQNKTGSDPMSVCVLAATALLCAPKQTLGVYSHTNLDYQSFNNNSYNTANQIL